MFYCVLEQQIHWEKFLFDWKNWISWQQNYTDTLDFWGTHQWWQEQSVHTCKATGEEEQKKKQQYETNNSSTSLPNAEMLKT